MTGGFFSRYTDQGHDQGHQWGSFQQLQRLRRVLILLRCAWQSYRVAQHDTNRHLLKSSSSFVKTSLLTSSTDSGIQIRYSLVNIAFLCERSKGKIRSSTMPAAAVVEYAMPSI